jgi:hypothetical protein
LPKFHAWWLLVIVPVLLATFAFGFIWWGSFNHSAEFAKALLSSQNGDFDNSALSAALAVKFPNGTPSAAVRQFAASYGATCYVGPASLAPFCGGDPRSRPSACATQVNDTLYCNVTLGSTFCFASGVTIQGHLDKAGTLSNVSARKFLSAC